MDVKPISVVAIKASVDSGSRNRPQQSFDGAGHGDDKDAQEEAFGEQADGQMPDAVLDDADDIVIVDAPELAPELPTPPKPGRYVNKVV